MARHEACELYIEQQIADGLEEGKTPYAIGKELSTWVAKLFEINIPKSTLETKAKRYKKILRSNELKNSESDSPKIIPINKRSAKEQKADQREIADGLKNLSEHRAGLKRQLAENEAFWNRPEERAKDQIYHIRQLLERIQEKIIDSGHLPMRQAANEDPYFKSILESVTALINKELI